MSRLVVYPVKSCAGIEVPVWPLDARGLRLDRAAMVVDATTGAAVTQREEPLLALVRPEVGDDGSLVLRTPGGAAVLPRDCAEERRTVTVWEHTGPARDYGDTAAGLLSEHLSRQVRLVGLAPDHARTADTGFAGPDVPVGFSDGYPLLIAADSSLADLNARLAEPLPMSRFRPNIVVGASPAYAEDGWGRITIGPIAVDVVKPCTRCAITTVDPGTGRRDGAEPLRELGRYRRGAKGVLFGQNAVHRATGELRVGDPVAV